MLGKLRIYEIDETYELTHEFQAHDNEIVSLDYSPLPLFSYGHLLASGSRDRLIHVYDGKKYYDILTKEHLSTAVVDVRFSESNDQIKLISSGAVSMDVKGDRIVLAQ